MIIERRLPPFGEWILEAARDCGLGILAMLFIMLVVGLFISAMKNGIARSFPSLFAAIGKGFEDILFLSPSRTWAIARLVIKESLRRRVLFLCVVFMLILMMADWFLNKTDLDPARLYLSLVSTTTCYLMLLMAAFLSAFSLPTDFKTKTIYTVATKPVRSSEMVLGRILGIGAVGTVILLFMAGVSYFFVHQSLGHTHLLTEREDLTEVSVPSGMNADDPNRLIFVGETRQAYGHKHVVEVLANGDCVMMDTNGHTHPVERVESPDGYRYIVGNAEGTLQSRVPIYGNLIFRGKDGMDARAGINVGDEWDYRSFIGGTGGSIYSTENKNQEAAFWEFTGVTPNRFPKEQFPNGIPVEMTLGVFRTHKGDMEQRISANIAVRNPKTGLFVDVLTFRTEEFIAKQVYIPFEIEGAYAEINQRRTRDAETGALVATPTDDEVTENATLANKRKYDLFEDLTDNGRFEVWLSCGDSQQYIGVAKYDLYLRAGDSSVLLNFIKGFYGTWLQMILLVCYGVVLSTFLSGAVTLVSTIGVMIAGFCKTYLLNIAFGNELGGGPVEAFVRILSQQNLVNDLPHVFSTTFIKATDTVLGAFLMLFGQSIPPLSDFNIYSNALASGFDITPMWMFQDGLVTIAYMIPLFIIGFLILSNREVAK